jgi:hypothetical protein
MLLNIVGHSPFFGFMVADNGVVRIGVYEATVAVAFIQFIGSEYWT